MELSMAGPPLSFYFLSLVILRVTCKNKLTMVHFYHTSKYQSTFTDIVCLLHGAF